MGCEKLTGEDFYLAFSPEREDPNNPDYSTATIPKVVGGVTKKTEAQGLYSRKKAQNTQKSTTYIELLAGKRQSRM